MPTTPRPTTPAVGDDGSPRPTTRAELDDARGAVAVGLWASGLRCVLQYVIAPALGAVGVVLGPVGLALQLLGTVTSVHGAWRLHRLGHRAWTVYAVVAGAVAVLTVVTFLDLLGARP